VDDLDEEGERADLAGAGPGGSGDQVAARGGDRRLVIGEGLHRRGQDRRVLDAEIGRGEGGQLVVSNVGRAEEHSARCGER
jgi:hypothetical protein